MTDKGTSMTTTSDLYNAIHFAKMADLSYCKANTIRRRLDRQGYGFKNRQAVFKFFHGPKGSTQAFGVANAQAILLCFRGTEVLSLPDWVVDLRFNQTPISVNDTEHQVFKGFWRALERTWPQIDDWLNKMYRQFPAAKLQLSGHSLGGALCSLTLVKLWQQQQLDKVACVYTFGCPRNVHQDLAAALNEQCKDRVFRFVNDEDLVTDIPPDCDLVDLDPMNYSHFGQLILFDQDGHAHYQDQMERWTQVRKRIRKKPWWRKIINQVADIADVSEPLRDHFINNYVSLCKARFEQFKR